MATKKKAVKKEAPQTAMQKLESKLSRLTTRVKKLEDIVGAEGTGIEFDGG